MADTGLLKLAVAPLEDLEDLYENAPCGYLSMQPEGRIIKVNATFCKWTGFSAPEIIGKRFPELLDDGGRIFYEAHFSPLLRMQGFFHEVALELVTARGEKISVLANAVERRNAAGEPLFTRITVIQATGRRHYERQMVGMRRAAEDAQDELQQENNQLEERIAEAVTARLQAEQGLTLSQAREKAAKIGLMAEREASELREQFIAVLGHDLRNPLAAIRAGLNVMDRKVQDESEKHIVILMLGSVHRMAVLIDNVMDFARARLGGGLSLDIHDEEVGPILAQVVSELRLSHPQRTIESDFHLSGKVPIDKSRVSQLVSNLLANAISHGSPHESVQIAAEIKTGHLEIRVTNKGEPIAPNTMQRLFQPFFRGQGRSSQKGLGLGLHIAAEIARAHGGGLSVSSTDEGTRFTFRMPIKVPGADL